MDLPSEQFLTLPSIFLERVSRYQTRQALLFRDPLKNRYTPISWFQWADFVRLTAQGLHGLGVKPKDRVAILSENRPEWTYADLGILSLGAVVVPIYPTSSCDEVIYILNNSEAEVLFLSNADQLQRLWPILEACPRLRHVILFDAFSQGHSKLIGFLELQEKGRREGFNCQELYTSFVRRGKSEDIATIIYTSGTTGPPKGVMLSHQNFVANYLGAKEKIQILEDDIALSFLPLSHVFERLAGYYFMSFHGATIAYAQNMQSVPEDILEIKPTVCAAVPRFYEKVYGKILEKVEAAPAGKKRLFYWAVSIGKKHAKAVFEKNRLGIGGRLRYTAAKILVFNQIKKKMGGRIRFFISGGAPLSKELAEFFFASDVMILEGYGLTETSPVMTVNAPDAFCFGTVGRPLSNVDVKIAEDGEIITRGPCVMQGYYKNPDATAEAMKDGWFHTGDIGVFENGFLKITDRKKDIIATSGGKKVSPQNIENRILSDALFSQVVTVGDKKNYLVALVVPNRQQVMTRAAGLKLEGLPYEQLLKHPGILAWIDERFRSKCQGLAPYEQIKYFALLPKEMSQDGGELTPTLKFKRKFIMEKYRDIIDKLYQPKPEAEPV